MAGPQLTPTSPQAAPWGGAEVGATYLRSIESYARLGTATVQHRMRQMGMTDRRHTDTRAIRPLYDDSAVKFFLIICIYVLSLSLIFQHSSVNNGLYLYSYILSLSLHCVVSQLLQRLCYKFVMEVIVIMNGECSVLLCNVALDAT